MADFRNGAEALLCMAQSDFSTSGFRVWSVRGYVALKPLQPCRISPVEEPASIRSTSPQKACEEDAAERFP